MNKFLYLLSLLVLLSCTEQKDFENERLSNLKADTINSLPLEAEIVEILNCETSYWAVIKIRDNYYLYRNSGHSDVMVPFYYKQTK